MQQQIYSHWHGYQNISHLVIFGDSYSDVGYRSSSMLHPSEEHPLGVVFPGYSWAEDHKPNWVGYLITEFAPGHAMLVYDYAVGGDRVNGVVSQIQRHFIPKVGQKPDWAPWSSDDTLFITWVGINDCAFIATEKNIRDSMDKLFEQQDHLYVLGARNFLFIDVPPIHRSPAGIRSILQHNSLLILFRSTRGQGRIHLADKQTLEPDSTRGGYTFHLYSP
ncbi:unnamed protein product [Somion occarium]|uniref:Carbohydrate esterase family 16 protein n=1 Tax=Somion occarium TaxID=3059160 RepID=A0ABP1D8I7_9APHY